MRRADQAEVVQQGVGELGDAIDEHQIEEQLDIGDLAVAARDTLAQQAGRGGG